MTNITCHYITEKLSITHKPNKIQDKAYINHEQLKTELDDDNKETLAKPIHINQRYKLLCHCLITSYDNPI